MIFEDDEYGYNMIQPLLRTAWSIKKTPKMEFQQKHQRIGLPEKKLEKTL